MHQIPGRCITLILHPQRTRHNENDPTCRAHQSAPPCSNAVTHALHDQLTSLDSRLQSKDGQSKKVLLLLSNVRSRSRNCKEDQALPQPTAGWTSLLPAAEESPEPFASRPKASRPLSVHHTSPSPAKGLTRQLRNRRSRMTNGEAATYTRAESIEAKR